MIGFKIQGNLIKKRVSLGSKGKSGGARTILAYKKKGKIFFIFGFDKGDRANITKNEYEALKIVGNNLLAATRHKILKLQENGEIFELRGDYSV